MLLIIILSFLYTPLCNLVGLAYRPDLLLALVFICSLKMLNNLNYPLLCISGAIFDVLNNHIIGITSIILILCAILVRQNIKALSEQQFAIIWLVFALNSAISVIAISFTDFVSYGTMINAKQLLLAFVSTSLIFPLIYRHS